MDVVWTSQNYHDMKNASLGPVDTVAMNKAIFAALKPGGRLVLVEYRGEDPAVPIKPLHKMTLDQVKKEMAIQPELEFVESIESLPWQHLIIFRKK